MIRHSYVDDIRGSGNRDWQNCRHNRIPLATAEYTKGHDPVQVYYNMYSYRRCRARELNEFPNTNPGRVANFVFSNHKAL